MKICSVMGKMNGKVGNLVMSTANGEVIGREYNPNVANPNTVAQQNTRSKFKLASQLSATMAPVIAIKKDGAKSGRNQFVQINFDSIRYNMGVADINLNVVQLTKSKKSFPGFNANRTGGSAIAVELNADSAAALSRVVYIAYKKDASGDLQMFDSKICNTPGSNGLFADVLKFTADSVVLYAYGIKDLESGVTSKFGNMQAPSAEDVATLLVSNTENMSSVQLTKTAGLTMAVGENTGDSDDVEHLTVSVVTSGNGSATGGGRFEAGQTATLRATPDTEAEFVAWKLGNSSGQVLSTANPYSFEVQSNITICAVFAGGPRVSCNVRASVDPAAGGSVTGAGDYYQGDSCTLACITEEGYDFVAWKRNGQVVSTSQSYTFTVESDVTLVAEVAVAPSSDFSNVTLNGTIVNDDETGVSTSGATIAGQTSNGSANKVTLVQSADKPTVGDTLDVYVSHTTAINISGGSFSGSTGNMSANSKYWLCAYHADSDMGGNVIDDIFEFSFTTAQ